MRVPTRNTWANAHNSIDGVCILLQYAGSERHTEKPALCTAPQLKRPYRHRNMHRNITYEYDIRHFNYFTMQTLFAHLFCRVRHQPSSFPSQSSSRREPATCQHTNTHTTHPISTVHKRRQRRQRCLAYDFAHSKSVPIWMPVQNTWKSPLIKFAGAYVCVFSEHTVLHVCVRVCV